MYVFFVPGSCRAVETELIIARGSESAHLKDGVPIFQILQKTKIRREETFL